MADGMIGAAPVGQPGAGSVDGGQSPVITQAPEQNQPQVNYVTNEQLNAAVDEIKRLVQSSTDKSYSRVQKMISALKQAGIQNPTEAQARALLESQEKSEPQEQKPDAQSEQVSAVSPEAEQWIRANGGDPSKSFWEDIYDVAQEAGVPMIVRGDPEYAQFFEENGQIKKFAKPRQFVRAFEQAFEAKKQRLSNQGNVTNANLASSPALGGSGSKGNYHDPKTTDRSDLITAGLHEQRRR